MGERIETSAEAAEAAAMPRVHEVHRDPEATHTCDMPRAVTDQPVARKSPAQWAYERTVLYLKTFEDGLDEDHEIAMGFAGADAGVLRIEGMGYFDPDIITFYGTDGQGGRMQLVQHVSQLSVVFRAVSKAVKTAAPIRIGFKLVEDLERGEAEG